ncbi:Putative lectin-domain receptor-like protein kinase family protein [Zea mays]|uniref:Putative lectin-domain receptor-like protein kinase family protein n=1 Tax=Zea mays TaxID=4577 RepID=A0A1D6Q8H1_MAIZE|nr:Putative lectin-domain receptor-like protein kinase family protein [Zea mays]
MTTGPWRWCHGVRATASLALLLLLACVSGRSVTCARAQSTAFTGRETTSFSFPKFDQNRLQLSTNLTFTGNSTVSQGALQVTPDSGNNFSTYLANQAGRVFYSTPFVLWASNASSAAAAGRRVASFSTVFQFNLYRTNASVKGEGLAFVVASAIADPPPGSHGGFLGLTNASTDGLGANGFAAVELDTVKQPYDPDGNHIGLDVNGVRSSSATCPLAALGIELAPADTGASDGSNFVWVDYDGAARRLRAYISPNATKPSAAALDASLDLSAVVAARDAYFGFSASTGADDYQLNCVKMWNMTVEVLHDDDDRLPKKLSGWKLGLAVGAPCAAALAALALLAGLYLMKKRRKVGDDPSSVSHSAIDLRSIPGVPKEFDYEALRKGTNGFDDKMKLGQGGYGVVYRATVPGDNGRSMEVAVKQFSGANTKGQEDFLAELGIINRLRHRNLVKLIGWCHQDGVLLLVYDYMPHGSLDRHLFGGREASAADWKQRYNVVAGVASALNYLHHEFEQTVIHRDIKPSNIMLDSSFHARLGDFGLARALESDKTSYTDKLGVPGTLGYIAPECFHTGRATRESDVFGFGAVVLETVCGRRVSCDNPAGCSQLLELVWRLHGAGRLLEAVDPRLAAGGYGYDGEEAERLLLLGLACSHPNPRQRPKAQAILQNLQTRSVPPLPVPMSKPVFMWPAPLADGEEDATQASSMSRSGVTSSGVTSSSNYPYTWSSSGYNTQTFQVSREVHDAAERDVATV